MMGRLGDVLVLAGAVVVAVFVLMGVRTVPQKHVADGVTAPRGKVWSLPRNLSLSGSEWCDALCEEFDAVSPDDPSVCEGLRRCGIPCDVSKRYMDVVYFWVNGSKPEHAARRKIDACLGAYEDSGDMRFSLRSLFRFGADFVRRVFIVSPYDDAPPVWLNQSHPLVRFFGPTRLAHVLPSFVRGWSAEHFKFMVHALPSLSSNFLFMEPDYMFVSNVTIDTFVNELTQQVVNRHRNVLAPEKLNENSASCQDRGVHAALHTVHKTFFQLFSSLMLGAEQPVSVSQYAARNIVRQWSLHEKLPAWDFSSFHRWVARCNGQGTEAILPRECQMIHSYSSLASTLHAFHQPPICFGMRMPAPPASLPALFEWQSAMATVLKQASPVEVASVLKPRRAKGALPYRCNYAKNSHVSLLGPRALSVPSSLANMHISTEQRDAWRANAKKLSWANLMGQIPRSALEHVDVENSFSQRRLSRSASKQLVVGEFNVERGKYWCEAAVNIIASPETSKVDIWLLNEMDLGMARSGNVHTTRLMAGALGLNYAWGMEFIELTHGTQREQSLLGKDAEDSWGFHGNAILSRWPLYDVSIVRLQDMEEYYTTSPHEPGEKRLAGRIALFAVTTIPVGDGKEDVNVTLVAMHMTTSWAKREKHVDAAIRAIKERINRYKNEVVLLGGDTWTFTCEKLGLMSLVKDRVGLNHVDDKGRVALGFKWRDDYICSRDVRPLSAEPVVLPTGFEGPDGKMVALSDHPMVTVPIELQY